MKLAPGDDFIMTNMYSLLNYIAATSKDGHDGSLSSRTFSASSSLHSAEESTMHSVRSVLQQFSEDQKRLIGISIISVVTRLALEFKSEEVRQCTAMI